MTIGLTVMRLQPLHNGHKKIIDSMLEENNLAFVLIGSANKKDSNNPFSFELRRLMLAKVYAEEIKSGKLKVLPVNDINNPPKWVAHVLNQLGGITPDKYYAGTDQDGYLFAEKGFEIRSFDRNELKISATMIREKLLAKDDNWKTFVPKAIIPIVETCFPSSNNNQTILQTNISLGGR